MGTRDQFSLDHMSYPNSYASPQFHSRYLPVVDNRLPQIDSQNYNFLYEQPPSAPFLAEPPELSPSSIASPPKYRPIQSRPSATGLDGEKPGDTLQVKPWKHQRQPQDTSGESTSAQLEAGVKTVSLANPENKRYELPDRLTLPRIPRLTQGPLNFSSDGVPFSQCTGSDLYSRNQGLSFAPYRFLPSNDLASAAEIRSPLFLNGASTSNDPVTDRPAHHHYAQCSLGSSDTQFSYPNASFELSQNQDFIREASIQFAEHLEMAQVLQSLSIVQDYMAKYPSIFEDQASEMVQRWILDIQSLKLSEAMSK
jgi:hypothetical protein